MLKNNQIYLEENKIIQFIFLELKSINKISIFFKWLIK
jgi:hypothetical protein